MEKKKKKDSFSLEVGTVSINHSLSCRIFILLSALVSWWESSQNLLILKKKISNGLFGVLILKQKYIVLLLILVGKGNNDISEIRIPLLE